FEQDEGLAEVRIALVDLVAQDLGLRVLASKAQHRGSGHVGMVQVAGNQSTEIARVFAGAATSSFMGEELHAIDVFEESACLLVSIFRSLLVILDGIDAAFAIEARKICDLLTIDLWRRISESLVEGLAQHIDVAVFAEDERHDQPAVTRAHLAVGAAITLECAILPRRDVGSMPGVAARLGMEL